MYQFNKRNEKNGIVCAACMQPETQENPCTWFCQSYCQRSYHDACKEQKFTRNAADSDSARRKGMWQCDDCQDNVAECFCCKQKGLILVFPKKGKPKAPGCSSQFDASPFTSGFGMNEGQMDEEDQSPSMRKEENFEDAIIEQPRIGEDTDEPK